MTLFEYNPEYQTLVKFKDGKQIDSLSVAECDLPMLLQILWDYLKDKKFFIEVEEKSEKVQ